MNGLRWLVAAGALAAIGCGSAKPEPSVKELQERVERLEARQAPAGKPLSKEEAEEARKKIEAAIQAAGNSEFERLDAKYGKPASTSSPKAAP